MEVHYHTDTAKTWGWLPVGQECPVCDDFCGARIRFSPLLLQCSTYGTMRGECDDLLFLDVTPVTPETVAALDDPVERIRAAKAAMAERSSDISALAAVRRAAAGELLARGMTHQAIGDLLGVTRQQAHRIATGGD